MFERYVESDIVLVVPMSNNRYTVNSHTKEERVYESAVSCAKELEILTTTLNWRLKTKGQKTFDKKFQFKYRTETLPFKE